MRKVGNLRGKIETLRIKSKIYENKIVILREKNWRIFEIYEKKIVKALVMHVPMVLVLDSL